MKKQTVTRACYQCLLIGVHRTSLLTCRQQRIFKSGHLLNCASKSLRTSDRDPFWLAPPSIVALRPGCRNEDNPPAVVLIIVFLVCMTLVIAGVWIFDELVKSEYASEHRPVGFLAARAALHESRSHPSAAESKRHARLKGDRGMPAAYYLIPGGPRRKGGSA
jgi:hypothetical protein